ncbi:hypothetical protein ACOME3_009410 [Neoechinorhynchus agilis]
MNNQKIVQLISFTLLPSTQEVADRELKRIANVEGFAASLLNISTCSNLPLAIRQASVIFLKNIIRRRWNKSRTGIITINNNDDDGPMPAADMIYVRHNICSHLRDADDLIRRQLVDIIRTILGFEADRNGWPEIQWYVIKLIKSNDAKTVLAALITLHEINKHHQYRLNPYRESVFKLFGVISPVLLGLLEQAITEGESDTSFKFIHLTFKSFRRLIQYDLPLNEIQLEATCEWINKACRVLSLSVPQRVQRIGDEAIRESHPFWKSLKWAGCILNHVVDKFGRPKVATNVYVPFSMFFLENFPERVVSSCLQVLYRFGNDEYVSSKVIFQILLFFGKGLSCNRIWLHMNGHVNFLIDSVVFRSLHFNDDEEDMIENEPIEFLTLKHEADYDFDCSSFAAALFIQALTRKRKEGFDCLMHYFNHKFGLYAQLLAKDKEVVLHMMGISACSIIKHSKENYSRIGEFLTCVVLPDCRSSEAFLRFRVFWLLIAFRNLPFHTDDVRLILSEAHRCLCDTKKELVVVRVEAASLFIALIKRHKLILRPEIDSNKQTILIELLDLIRESEYDGTPRLLREFVKLIGTDISLIASDVISSLADTYICLVMSSMSAASNNEEDQSEEVDESRAMAVMEISQALCNILSSLDCKTCPGYSKIETNVLRIARFVLSHPSLEFLSDVIELIFEITNDRISDECWTIFDTWCEISLRHDGDTFVEMINTFYNFVNNGRQSMFENDRHTLLFRTCKTLITTNTTSGSGDIKAMNYAAKLIENLVLQSAKVDVTKFDRRLFLSDVTDFFLEKFLVSDNVSSNIVSSSLLNVAAVLFVDLEVFVSRVVSQDSTLPVFLQFLEKWINRCTKYKRLHAQLLQVVGFSRLIDIYATSASLRLSPEHPQHGLGRNLCADIEALLPQIGQAIFISVHQLQRTLEAKQKLNNEVANSLYDEDESVIGSSDVSSLEGDSPDDEYENGSETTDSVIKSYNQLKMVESASASIGVATASNVLLNHQVQSASHLNPCHPYNECNIIIGFVIEGAGDHRL